jgi:hypothetical protein
MQDEITALIEEAAIIINTEMNCFTHEYQAFDRLLRALKLLNEKVTRMDSPAEERKLRAR